MMELYLCCNKGESSLNVVISEMFKSAYVPLGNNIMRIMVYEDLSVWGVMGYGLVDRYTSGREMEKLVLEKHCYLSTEPCSGKSQKTLIFLASVTKTSSLKYSLNKIINVILFAGNCHW
jgi:hypothetical protein